MDILTAIKGEEKKVRKQLARIQNQLNGLASAAEALRNSTSRQVVAQPQPDSLTAGDAGLEPAEIWLHRRSANDSAL